MTSEKHILTLRISKVLDEKISELSKKIGISKNAYILTVLNNQFNSLEQ